MHVRALVVSSRRTRLSIARTLVTVAVATTLTLLAGACSREVTEPTDSRPTTPNAKPSLSLSGSAVWNGHTVSIESRQLNSAGQTVCLDIPWGIAFSGQDVNYFPCHYAASQQFVLSAWDAGFGESWVIVTPVSNSSVCFDIRGGTTNGAEHLQLYTCSTAPNQTFLLPAASSPSGFGVPLITTICVERGYPNLVLDVPLPASVSSYVQQFKMNHGQNQLWRFRDSATGQYFISPTGSPWNNC